MQKTGWNVSTLSLKADPGEAFLVEEIKVATTDPVEFTKVLIDRVTVGYLSTFNIYTNQFWFSHDMAQFPNLMRTLFNQGVFKGYPIAEGQEMVVDITGASSPYARINYQVLEPGDIKPDQENGSHAKEYLFFNYGTNSAAITDGNEGKIDKCLTPVEFPDFPFGALVPPKTEIDIVGILIGTYRKAVEFNNKFRWLKLMRGREVLFDEDRKGFYCAGGMLDYPFHAYGLGRWYNPLPEPLNFKAGDELTLMVTVGGGDLAADASLICLIEKVRKVE
jgi:hypothetical protein